MRRLSRVAIVLCAVALLPAMAEAQSQPDWSVGAYGLLYTGISSVDDPETGRWDFSDSSFGAGATLLRRVGATLHIGVDAAYARPKYEIVEGASVQTGDAQIATLLAVGRMAYGGAGDLGIYLTGGAGIIAYDVMGWNSDFALRAGTGIEYAFNQRRAAFLEWGRVWGYHEQEGVSGGTATHSLLKLGARITLR